MTGPSPNAIQPERAPHDEAASPFESEFLSEASPEFEALRESVASRRERAPGPSRPLFGQSGETPGPDAPPRGSTFAWWLAAMVLVGIAVATPAYWFFGRQPSAPSATPPSTAAAPGTNALEGVLVVESRPTGAEVYVAGTLRGVTPLRLTLASGAYPVEVRAGAATKTVDVLVEPGSSLRESIELPATAPTTGRLDVNSDLRGARVLIDGLAAGVTPLSLGDVPPGVHRVTIIVDDRTVTRSVTVAAGAAASVYLPSAPTESAATAGGWVSIDAPFEMRVIEGGQVVGTTNADRIMLPVGRRELELAATKFDFRTGVVVDVRPGATVTVPVEVPTGTVAINAVPWAEIWLDGDALGQTPLGGLSVPVGVHTVVWRHPQLGERQQQVTVAAGATVRVGVDLTAPR